MSHTHPSARREYSEASAHRSGNGDGTTGPSASAAAGAAPSLRAVHTPNFPGLIAGNLAFVGLPQVRESAVFSAIPITERLKEEERTCGVCVVDLASGRMVALLRFDTTVQEIFAVTVLPGQRWPELINDDDARLGNSFVVPDAALAEVPAALRAPAIPAAPLAELGDKPHEVCAQACG